MPGSASPILPPFLLHHAQALLAHALGTLDFLERAEQLVRLLARHGSRPARRRRRRRGPDLRRRGGAGLGRGVGRGAAGRAGAGVGVGLGVGRRLLWLWLGLGFRRRLLLSLLLLALPSQQHLVVPARVAVAGGALERPPQRLDP